MATDIAAFRAAVQRELVEVEAAIAAIDVQAEKTRFAADEAEFNVAQRKWNKAQRRQSLLTDKQARRKVLNEQLDTLS